MLHIDLEEVRFITAQYLWRQYSKFAAGDFLAPLRANLEWVLGWYRLRGMVDPSFRLPDEAHALVPGLLNLSTREYYRYDHPGFPERPLTKAGREKSIEILAGAGIELIPGRMRDDATQCMMRFPEFCVYTYWHEPGFIAMHLMGEQQAVQFMMDVGISPVPG